MTPSKIYQLLSLQLLALQVNAIKYIANEGCKTNVLFTPHGFPLLDGFKKTLDCKRDCISQLWWDFPRYHPVFRCSASELNPILVYLTPGSTSKTKHVNRGGDLHCICRFRFLFPEVKDDEDCHNVDILESMNRRIDAHVKHKSTIVHALDPVVCDEVLKNLGTPDVKILKSNGQAWFHEFSL